ncbi:MAG: fibronectin type III domain-containing protein [Thermoplasmata archaeon]|nr:fibronectin type III domain-containing protein [Candidatus Sysuiplasma jiujiangense]
MRDEKMKISDGSNGTGKLRMLAVALVAAAMILSAFLVFGAALSLASTGVTHISNTVQHYSVWTVTTPTVVSNSTIYAGSVVVTNSSLLSVVNGSSVVVNYTVVVEGGATMNMTSSTLIFNSSSSPSDVNVYTGSNLQFYRSLVTHAPNSGGGLDGASYYIYANSTSASAKARISVVSSELTQLSLLDILANATGTLYNTTVYSHTSYSPTGPVYNDTVNLFFNGGSGSLGDSSLYDTFVAAQHAPGLQISANRFVETENSNSSLKGNYVISVMDSNGISVAQNSLTGIAGEGIILFLVNDSYLSRNSLSSGFAGIGVVQSNHNLIEDNRIVDSGIYGLVLLESYGNSLYSNTMRNESFNFGNYWTYGMDPLYLYNTVASNNTVNGLNVYYIVNGSSMAFSNAGYITFVNSRNMTVTGANLTSNIVTGTIYNSSGISVSSVSNASMEAISGLDIVNSTDVALSNSDFSNFITEFASNEPAIGVYNVNGFSLTDSTVNNITSSHNDYAVDAFNTTSFTIGYSNLSNDYYGALSFSSNFSGLTITHSKMTGNYYGGVGYNGITYATDVSLIDSNFSNDYYGGVGYGGLTGQGSIAYTNNLKIVDSLFANDFAGGIGYQSIAYTNNTYILNSTFTNDYLGGIGYASANFAFYYSSNVTIMGSNLSSDYYGGIGYYPDEHTSNLRIIDSTLTNDTYGGFGNIGLFAVSGLAIMNSNLSNDLYGGIGYYGISGSNNITIWNSTLSNDYYGGIGYYGLSSSSNILIAHSTFNNDTYGGDGASGMNQLANIHIIDDKFTNSYAGLNSITSSAGVVIQGSVFSNDEYGLGSLANDGNVVIDNSTFSHNIRSGIGSITDSSNVVIMSSVLSHNNKGISDVYSSDLIVVKSNVSNDYGGGIYVGSYSYVSVQSSVLDADYFGPLDISSNAYVAVNNSVMTGNEQGISIGSNSFLLIENSTVNGLLYTLSMSGSTVIVYNSTVNTNNTQFSGNLFLEAQMARVQVLDAAGNPLSGIYVNVYSAGQNVYSGFTGKDGYTPYFFAYTYEMSYTYTGVPLTTVVPQNTGPYTFSSAYDFYVSSPMTTLVVNATSGVSRPTAPNDVSATAGNGYILVKWLAPSSSGSSPITGYNVTLTWSGGSMTTQVSANTLDVNFTGLTNGVTYTVTVTAESSLGTGPASSPVTATPTQPLALPGATDLSQARLTGTSQATLTWSAVSGATEYEVLMGTSPSQMAVIATVNSTSYTVTGLSPGTTYYFSIRAVNSAGAGQQSNVQSVSTATSSAQQFADYAPGISLIIIAIAAIAALAVGVYVTRERKKKL